MMLQSDTNLLPVITGLDVMEIRRILACGIQPIHAFRPLVEVGIIVADGADIALRIRVHNLVNHSLKSATKEEVSP